jgi:hypothetical protein
MTPRVTLAVTVGAALAAAVSGAPRPAAAQPTSPPRVRSGVTVTPDTVTVGDPFEVRVRVAAPAGAVVTFPTSVDSGGPVALLDPPRERAARAPDGGVDVTATYRAAAWDVGARLPVGLGDVTVRVGGAERRVSLGTARVTVRSVLPADTARRAPKPLREPVPDAGLWWLPLALAAAAALALVLLLVWLARRAVASRRARRPADQAYGAALAAFDRLDRLGLVAAGEGGRHVALATEVLREYLAARLPAAGRALTSGELVVALAPDPDVPGERLAAHLAAADLVKFAAVRVAPADAGAAGAEARGLVEAVEAGVRARERREAAEAAERARAERDARRRYEEERRRVAKRRAVDEARRAATTGAPPEDRERAA